MSTDWKEYLMGQGAVFQGTSLTGFTGQPEIRHSHTVSVLCNRSFITINGPDTQKFLQGQVSVHMDQLPADQHTPGVACTPKGRMYSSFRLLNTGNEYLCSLDSSITEHTLTTLGKYAVFFNSDLNHTENLIALGLSGQNCTKILEPLSVSPPEVNEAIAITGGHLLQVKGHSPRFELWISPDSLPLWWEKLMIFCTPVPSSHWQLLDIESVQPSVTSAILEKYIPQHLNMPSLGGVSFRKGCYTGQEIVTRMQSLGQQKSRTYHLQSSEQLNIECGAKVYDANGKGVGEVLVCEYAVDTQSSELLAVIRIETAEQGKAFLDTEQKQSVHVLPLPYTVDNKAELQQ